MSVKIGETMHVINLPNPDDAPMGLPHPNFPGWGTAGAKVMVGSTQYGSFKYVRPGTPLSEYQHIAAAEAERAHLFASCNGDGECGDANFQGDSDPVDLMRLLAGQSPAEE